MLPDELNIIYQQTTRPPYVTILAPLPETNIRDKRSAFLLAEKAVQKASNFLRNMYPREADALLASMQTLLNRIGRKQDLTCHGIGLYVSPGYNKLVLFPFPVQEKVHINDGFAMRELLYLEQYAISYFVLQVNGKAARLYKGRLNKLQAIKDRVFPRQLHDNYEYSLSARLTAGAGQAGFAPDSSVIKTNRLESFYRETDLLLGPYLEELPLVLAGAGKDISLLREISGHKKNIIAVVNHNCTFITEEKLAERIWPAVRSWIDGKRHDIVLELIEEKWRQHTAEGLGDVWTAVMEGRARRLIVEKDYACTAFLDEKTGRLYPKAPKMAHRIIIDAVDDVLRLAAGKGTEVRFVNNGALDDHDHIAVITKY